LNEAHANNSTEGFPVGLYEGIDVGNVGMFVGRFDGAAVGWEDGRVIGWIVGEVDGPGKGRIDGNEEGNDVGIHVE
jgi:hypothetical protein